jgi:hypothetical protein
VASALDLRRLAASMMLNILGQIPGSIVTKLLIGLPRGSYLALSDGTGTPPG